jgi:hypothetical protein
MLEISIVGQQSLIVHDVVTQRTIAKLVEAKYSTDGHNKATINMAIFVRSSHK